MKANQNIAQALLALKVETKVEVEKVEVVENGRVVYSSTTTTTTTLKDVKDLTKKKRRRHSFKGYECVCLTYSDGTVEYDKKAQYNQFQKIAQERDELINWMRNKGINDLVTIDRMLVDKGYKGLTLEEVKQLLG